MMPFSPYNEGISLLRTILSTNLATAGMTDRILVFFCVVVVSPSLLRSMGLAEKRYLGQYSEFISR